ncbi:amino acid ABC transporter permease [Photobacterium makurazakiensis]|uniref:amino acid ABC transporter permease n=1 Tax=Photobacterium makurazakiensis TaxID=2910234 RepID=UPI003D1009C9
MSYHLDLLGLAPYILQLLSGTWATIQLTVISTFGGLLLGTVCAAGRINKQRWLRLLCASYVELIRNTPFIVQLFFIFFGLPAIGIKLTAWQAGSIAMVVNLGAYSAEIIRAGIEAAPKGQWEAGRVLGLTNRQTFMHIILPPAYQRVYPAITSQCIIVMLGSAVVSQISVEELTFAANFAQSRSFLSFEAYLITALIYLLLSMLMRQVFFMVKQVTFKNPLL